MKMENLPTNIWETYYLGQYHGSVKDVITDGLIVLTLNMIK